MDEGALLVYPERVLAGSVPHRDFETLYGPANPWFLAGAFRAFGPSLAVERGVGVLYRAAIVLALVLFIRFRGVPTATVTGLLAIGLLSEKGVPALAWWAALAAALWSLLLVQRKRPLLAGAIGGVGLVFRPDLLLAMALGFFPFRSTRYVMGLVLGLALYLPHLVMVGPGDLVESLILDPIRTNPSRRLPLPLGSPIFWLVLGSVAVLIATGLAVRRRDGDARFLAMALFSAGLLPQALQRADEWHLVMAGVVPISLLPGALDLHLRSWWRHVSVIAFVAAGVGILSVALLPSASHAVTRGERTIYVGLERDARDLSLLLDDVAVRTRPGDRIFVGPSDLRRTIYNDTFVYFLLPDLVPATYFLEMNPGSANRPGSGLASDIASADIVILTHRYATLREPNASSTPGATAAQSTMRELFCAVSYHGPWELLARC